MKKPFRRLFLFFAFSLFVASQANAALKIDITQGNAEPLPIALPEMSGDSQGIMGVVANDLESTGLFRIIGEEAYIEKVQSGSSPRFADWRQINAQALVTGSVRQAGGGKEVEFRLWDIFAGNQIAGKAYTTEPENWRRIGHLIADEIYKRLTGEQGYFDTRIVYIAESGRGKNKVKRLAIMDQDGFNHKYLSGGGTTLVLTPHFSPSSQQIVYLSYAGNKPRVRVRDIASGREEIMGDFPGMTFAPRFSPNGRKVAMSVSSDGNTEIYEMDVSSRSKRRLTNDPAIDTSPSYSPDGSQIVFNSDRGGSQQLYVMSAGGGEARRISFGSGRYGSPAWSPRGDFIAFTKQEGGQFSIGVMRADGSGERILASAWLAESPTWSPNGRVIAFTKENRGGRSRLASVDITGQNEREINTPGDASDPAWSPLLD